MRAFRLRQIHNVLDRPARMGTPFFRSTGAAVVWSEIGTIAPIDLDLDRPANIFRRLRVGTERGVFSPACRIVRTVR
jgi:hypothetical protein